MISVIVPVYNVELYLEQCIDSILRQTYYDLEIILIDDGSTDNCPQICDNYARIDSRVKVIHKINGGQSSARNCGLKIAKGDFIAFVDSDDYIDETMLSRCLKVATEKKCDIVHFECKELIDNSFQYIPCNIYGEFSKNEFLPLLLQDTIGSQPCFALYKRESWKGIFFPEGRIFEDLACLYKVYEQCKTNIYCLNEALYIYRIHKESTSFTISPDKCYNIYQAFKERWLFAKDKYPQVEEACFLKVADTALGAYNYYLRFFQNSALFQKEKLNDIFNFITINKKRILKIMPWKRKILFYLFLLNKPTYIWLHKKLRKDI